MFSKRLSSEYLDELKVLLPDAKCGLDYSNLYELLISVILSAQTTDKRVNIVTKELFKKYPNFSYLKNACFDDVKSIISSLGLAQTKTRNIIEAAKMIVDVYDGVIPNNIDDLMKLPGVGRKVANVMLVEGFKIPAMPVDTHVFRVANRLGLSDKDTPEKVENDLKCYFEKDDWHLLHHLLIAFGRDICHAKKPDCDVCPFKYNCKYLSNND